MIYSSLIAAVLVYPAWAMIGGKDSPTAPVKMAPFSADDVIEHAKLIPDWVEVDYLQSRDGKKHVQKIIEAINSDEWPEDSSIKALWSKSQLGGSYNKFLVGEYASKKFKRDMEGLSPDERIVKNCN